MSALDQPGQQQGLKASPVAQPIRHAIPFWQWFYSFLQQELKPYPGRGFLVLRYTVAATVTMLLIVTFRLPGAAVGGFYSLLLSRDSPTTTLRGGLSTLAAFIIGLVFVLLGAILFVDYPLTHFLWVIVSFFLAFYGISAISNYGAATAFAIIIVLSVPLWDQHGSQADILIANLWTAASVVLAIVVTVFVEFVFSLFHTKDELIEGLDDRLEAIQKVLHESARGSIQHETAQKLSQFAIVGVSRLRRLAISANTSQHNSARLSTVVSLAGRLVDTLAAFHHFERFTEDDAPRLKHLEDMIATLRLRLRDVHSKASIPPLEMRPDGPIILLGLEQSVNLLRMGVAPEAGQSFALDEANPSQPPLFKPDLFTNPEHLQFALRGCLASVLCYVLFNAVFWPGLSPSLFTCVVTALTSIGTSRQKQLLRTSGSIVGGLFLGIGSQVLILPLLDTIVGFTVMFVVVTLIAAWFITASPRLSYFGTQMALAFYLIQLRGAFPQTNLAIARDNVMGILLGLAMMWLVFETLGSKPAVQVMRELFADNLRQMAHLARPWPDGKPADLKKIRTLRDKISQNFAAVNSQADAVLFEVGHSRDRSLAFRERLLDWQPQLRSLFLLQVALLQYRLQVSPRDLPSRVLQASVNFDREISSLLKGMAEVVQHRSRHGATGAVRAAFSNLKQAIEDAYRDRAPLRSKAVLALSSQIIELSTALLTKMEESSL